MNFDDILLLWPRYLLYLLKCLVYHAQGPPDGLVISLLPSCLLRTPTQGALLGH